MASRNFYIQLILRIILITATALGMAYSWEQSWYVLTAALLMFLIFQTWSLIYYVNRTNRKIAYFFDAIRNEDFTLRFPENVTIKSFKELNHSLNRVNGLIQQVHMQLQSREQYYRQILSQASIGIMTYNEKGHILYSNPTLERLLNYKPLNHIRQLSMVDKGLLNLFSEFEPFDNRIFNLSNEREHFQLVMKSTAMSLNGETVLVVTVQDIQKQLDEKEADSWVRLIRVLTHEILNTITPITSLSESILSYYKEDGEVDGNIEMEIRRKESTIKGLNVIKEQGNDLMEFVQSYRSFLNIPPPDKSLVSALKLIGRIEVMIDEQNKNPNLQIETSVQPSDLELYVDERQISQVLINLTKNAIHALSGRDDGVISIMAGVNSENNAFIEVSDNGSGIPVELLDQIFVPFFTTKRSGTGIGLSLSRQIVHLHGGRMTVDSVPGEKTTFMMKF